jgi:nitrite reductase/ring-hydroxylating ferredoxin subunit
MIRLELRIEPDTPRRRYVSRTLEGPGARSEIWTAVEPRGPDRVGIEVQFWVPDVPPERIEAVGAGFTALYTRLWDEDEAMMIHRQRALAAEATPPPDVLDLGPADEVSAHGPVVVDWGGRPIRVVRWQGGWLAHSARCPHWLGPVEEGPDAEGRVRCPWHGYRFDPSTRESCDGRRLRLAPAPIVEEVGGRVRLVAP